MTYKTPFLVYQQFLTQEECARIADAVRVEPDVDLDTGIKQPMTRAHNDSETLIYSKFKPLVPHIEEHFGLTYKATETIQFKQFPVSNELAEQPHCDNAVFKRKKWVRVSGRDLSCVLWLKDYQDQPPFDLKRHVYGGKLEFPVYNFSFQPQAGTLVVFPSCERFIQATGAILVGELQLAQFWVHAKDLWLYNPADFPGDFRVWFSDVV